MNRRPRVLVSGGTGFLGSQVLPRLNEIADTTLLSRNREGCIKSDLSKWNGGLEPKELKGEFDVFLHMAGLYDLRSSEKEAFNNNITGTHSALAIATQAEIPQFIHISTIATTINNPQRRRPLSPDSLTLDRAFPDAYAKSKAHAEQLVRRWPESVIRSRLILRLGALVGDTTQGTIHRIDGPYLAPFGLKRLLPIINRLPRNYPLPLPGHRHSKLPLVPVDCAASAIVNLLDLSQRQPSTGTQSLYVVSQKGPTQEEFFRSVLRFLAVDRDFKMLSRAPDWLVKPTAEWLGGLPRQEVEYLLHMPPLDITLTERLLGDEWSPPFSTYEDSFWRGYEQILSHR